MNGRQAQVKRIRSEGAGQRKSMGRLSHCWILMPAGSATGSRSSVGSYALQAVMGRRATAVVVVMWRNGRSCVRHAESWRETHGPSLMPCS